MEKTYSFGTEPSPIDSRDYVLETILPTEEYVPSTLDYRPMMMKVRDQGSQGTCSAQTAAAMKEWQERKEIGMFGHMSPQFIYNNRENQDSEGMYPRNTMKIIQKLGCAEEMLYPYGKIEKPSEITDIVKNNALKFRVESYASIFTIDAVKKALYKHGPCYIAFPVYNYGMEFWKPNTGDRMLGGHAVTIVGYTKNAFIIRNSWSEQWGDNGYTYYPFSHWGMHREIWTTIDATTGLVKTPKSLWQRFLIWLKEFFA